MIVQARTEQVVECSVGNSVDKEAFLFTPIINESNNILTAYSVSECNKEGNIFVSILNRSDKLIELKSAHKIGTVVSDFAIVEESK